MRNSPNENPHLELALQSGDYVLVHGHMDEDQFYFGETLTGRTGLVPSNYVERVPDYLLLQNAARTPSAQISPSNSCSGNGGNDIINNSIVQKTNFSSTGIGTNSPTTRNSPLLNRRVFPLTRSISTQSPSIKSIGESPTTVDASANVNIIDNHTDCNGLYIQNNDISALPSTSSTLFGANNTTTFQCLSNTYNQQQQNNINCLRHCNSKSCTKDSRSNSPSFVLNVPMHHAQIIHDFTDFSYSKSNNNDNNNNFDRTNNGQNFETDKFTLPDSVCPYPPVDVLKVTVQEVKQPDKPRGLFNF